MTAQQLHTVPSNVALKPKAKRKMVSALLVGKSTSPLVRRIRKPQDRSAVEVIRTGEETPPADGTLLVTDAAAFFRLPETVTRVLPGVRPRVFVDLTAAAADVSVEDVLALVQRWNEGYKGRSSKPVTVAFVADYAAVPESLRSRAGRSGLAVLRPPPEYLRISEPNQRRQWLADRHQYNLQSAPPPPPAGVLEPAGLRGDEASRLLGATSPAERDLD